MKQEEPKTNIAQFCTDPLNEGLNVINDFIELEKHLGLGFNPVAMYLAFMEQHKQKNGSLKSVDNYYREITLREYSVAEMMNTAYECRLHYETSQRSKK